MYAPQFGAPPQGYAMPPYDFDHHTTPPMSPSPATSYYSPRHAPQFTQASPRTSPGPGKTSDYGNQLSAANPFVRQQRNPIHDFSSSEDTPGVPVRKPIRHTWPEKVSNYQNQMPVLQAGNFVDTSHRRPKGVSPESLASKLSRHFTGRDSARGPYLHCSSIMLQSGVKHLAYISFFEQSAASIFLTDVSMLDFQTTGFLSLSEIFRIFCVQVSEQPSQKPRLLFSRNL
jgi:hypothetical protein